MIVLRPLNPVAAPEIQRASHDLISEETADEGLDVRQRRRDGHFSLYPV
jgi:hypothetical protein